jgi:exonuclease SbcC
LEHSALSLNVKEAREAEKHLVRLETVHKQLATDSEQLQRREAQIAAIDAEIATLAYAAPEKLRQLRVQLLGIDGELKLAREASLKAAELQPLLQRLEEIEQEGKRKRDERESVAAAAAAAETLTNELTELERRLSSLNDPRARSMALKAEAESAPVRLVELSKAKDSEKKLQEEAESVDQRMVQFAELDAALNAAVSERDRSAAAHRDYVTFEVVARTLPSREAEFASAELEASKASTEAGAALSEFEDASKGYDREAHLQARASLLSLREKSASVTAQVDAARLQNANLTSEISRLDEVRATMREEFKSRERLEQLRETTEFIRETLKTAGPIVTESYLFNISAEANQLFREISGEAGRTLKWTRDYEIVIEEDGYERSFPNLSGGEQMAAALSIRLALLKQLSDIRLAFFDEPTTNMDAERRERLAQQIGQVRHFDQLFVISHDDTFEESVDNIIHVQRQDDRLSSSTAALVQSNL